MRAAAAVSATSLARVREASARFVDRWWASLFGIGGREVWRCRSVRSHTLLGGYPGWYVAWRGAGVHVSAPAGYDADELESLVGQGIRSWQDPGLWAAFARRRGLGMIGPAVHAYLDEVPAQTLGRDLVELTGADLESLRAQVATEEWSEAGMTHEPPPALAWGVVEDGRPVAAAVLSDWDGAPRDVGVIVTPGARGRGSAGVAATAAASYAVREHGIARWRSATANRASLRTAERLGFEPYATQLAIR